MNVNTSEYVLQMCRPVTLQVNTLTDGQLRTGWPRRFPPGESVEEGRRREEEGLSIAEKRGGVGSKGREERDLC